MGLMRLESIKVIRNKKNIVILIISMLIVSLFFILNFENSKKINPLSEYIHNKQQLQQSISQMKRDPVKNSAKKRAIKNAQQQLQLLNNQIKANKEGNWKKELKIQISLDQKLVEGIQSGHIVGSKSSISPLIKEIQLDTKLVNRNIHPAREPFESVGFNFTYRLLFYFFPLLMPLLIIVLIGDISTKEKRTGMSNLVNIFPVRLKKILDIRIITSVIFSSVISILPLLAAFIIGSLINHTGSWRYPIAIHLNETKLLWITIVTFLVRALLLIISLCVFISIFIHFLNTFIKNTLLLLFVTIGFFYFFDVMSNIHTKLNSIMQFIPFAYSNIPNIVTGEIAATFNNPYINVTNGVITLLLSSVIFYVLSLYILNKKRMI